MTTTTKTNPETPPFVADLAITGGIATGKSTAARILAGWGAAVVDADAEGRAILAPGGEAVEAVAARFGDSVRSSDGGIDRSAVSAIIFSDPHARKELETITHPLILGRMQDRMADVRNSEPDRLVVIEVPLLFETGMQRWARKVLVVSAPKSQQVARLVDRSGLSLPEANERIAAQMPLAEKEACADFVVSNDGTESELAGQLEAVWNQICSTN